MLHTIQDWIANYGWYAIAVLSGALVTMIAWMVKHPEDFYTIEEEDEENEKPVRADK